MYCENHAKVINILCVQKAQFLNVTATGRLLGFKQFVYAG